MKKTFTYITEEATTDEGLNRQQRLQFHAFNPNGLCAKKRKLDEVISKMVEQGKVKPGWIVAYGTFDSYYYDRVMKHCRGTKPSVATVSVLIKGFAERLANAWLGKTNKQKNKIRDMLLDLI